MKSLLFLLLFLFWQSESSANPNTSNLQKVSGRHFTGKPGTSQSEPGCEGCGEPGYAIFGTNGKVEFAYPGSDLIDSGKYTQKGRTITIQLDGSEKLIFWLSSDGKEIISKDKLYIYRDKKFPWK